MTSNVESDIQLGLGSSKHNRYDKQHSNITTLTTISESDYELLLQSTLKKQKKLNSSTSQLSAGMSSMVIPASELSLNQAMETDIDVQKASNE